MIGHVERPLSSTKAYERVGARRVLLGSTLYYPNVGGIENSLLHLSQAYRRGGLVPWILTSTGGDPNPTGRRFEVKRIHGVPTLRYRFSSLAPLRLLRAWWGLRILRRRLDPGAMISRDQHTALAAILEGQPCVYLVPGLRSVQHKVRDKNPLRWANHIASTIMQRVALRRAGCVAVFSQSMAEAVKREAARTDTAIVRPGVDGNRFLALDRKRRSEARRRLALPDEATIAVAVGRFARLKRFDLAIDSLSSLGNHWHLVLVGDGPLRGELERHANDQGLAHRVTFTGQISDPEKYLQLADVYLLTSEHETFGQVLLEAMACGLPIVAFDPDLPDVDTATDEVVPAEWLFRAKRKDAKALSRAMVEAVEAGCEPERIAQWTAESHSWRDAASVLARLGGHGRRSTHG